MVPATYAGPITCGRCQLGSMVDLETHVLEPAFIAAGYGEATAVTLRGCPVCYATEIVRLQAQRPAIRP